MFVGRKAELLQMNKMYRSDQFECLILYGRRRVGKTFLINEFVKDKRTIYFTGTEGSAEENLVALSQSIYLWDHESG